MAAVIISKPVSVTWNSTAVSGCISASIQQTTDIIADESDGAVHARKSATRTTKTSVTANFITCNGMAAAVTAGATHALVIVGKDGRGSSNVTYTMGQATVIGKSVNIDGSGSSVSFDCTSSDGSANPVSIT